MHFNVSAFARTHTIAYYMMKPICNKPDIPVLMAWTETLGFGGGDAYGEMSVCGDWLIQSWLEEKQIAVNITRAPTTRREETPTKTLCLWTPTVLQIPSSALIFVRSLVDFVARCTRTVMKYVSWIIWSPGHFNIQP